MTTTAYDDVIEATAREVGADVPDFVAHIKATIAVESGFNPDAVSAPNKNGTIDYGLMQLNGDNLALWGLSPDDALDPGTNIYFGARLLADNFRKAVGADPAARWVVAHAAYNSGWSHQRPGDAPRHADGSLVSQSYVARVLAALGGFGSPAGEVAGGLVILALLGLLYVIRKGQA